MKKICAFCVIFLCASTVWALLQFSWSKDRYPLVRYPAPNFRPEVIWQDNPPSDWVRLASVPRAAWLAVVAAEDGGFFKHSGVEWSQSFAKIRADLAKKKFPKGISTLNQQLAKNLFFGARPVLLRKFQELVVAEHMDSELSKNRILEIYLNIVEWGPEVVGIGAAARYYFRKRVSQLSDYECALLANLLPNPRVRGAWVRDRRIPNHLSRRVNRTFRRLTFTERAVQSHRRIEGLWSSGLKN